MVGFGGRDRISGTPHPESHTESSMVHPDNSFSPRRLDTALDRASAAYVCTSDSTGRDSTKTTGWVWGVREGMHKWL